MRDSHERPSHSDAVLGGQNRVPRGAMVLGGVEGVRRRLSSPRVEHRIAALYEALNCGTDGLDLIIERLHDRSWKVRQAAYSILEKRTETQARQALRRYDSYNNCWQTWRSMGRLGGVDHVDTMMLALENDSNHATGKAIEESLDLVETIQGQNRLKDYLLNGTPIQRNYAASYFKKKGGLDFRV